MRLTPLEWGLRAPINPAARGELLGATAPWQNRSEMKKNKPALNTKLRILPLVMEGYKHHRIHHHDNEFARARRHINDIESFWSYAKLRLAKLRGVRWEYFYDHLKETEWALQSSP